MSLALGDTSRVLDDLLVVLFIMFCPGTPHFCSSPIWQAFQFICLSFSISASTSSTHLLALSALSLCFEHFVERSKLATLLLRAPSTLSCAFFVWSNSTFRLLYSLASSVFRGWTEDEPTTTDPSLSHNIAGVSHAECPHTSPILLDINTDENAPSHPNATVLLCEF